MIQMRSASLPKALPGVVDAIIIADQDTSPVRDKLCKRRLGAGRMHLKVGHQWVGHHPKPLPVSMGEPGGFVNMVDWGASRHLPNQVVVGDDRLRDAIDHLLDSPLTERNAEHRATQVLHRAAT